MKKYCLFLVGIFFSILTYSQKDSLSLGPEYGEIKTIFQHLQGYQKILIKTNLDSLMLNKTKGKKQGATLISFGKDLSLLELPIKIAARGKFRRKKCDLPPIWIDFPKVTLRDWGLYPKYDKLKLVTHCLLETENRLALLKEYWIYKMHNQLTENSFRVHLIEIIYVHSEDSKRKIKNLAFLIESAKEMAHRLNGEIIEGMGKKPSEVTPVSYNQTLMFNYMIGNTDWNLELQKNLKLVKKEDHEKLTLVPYDFDFTALTNPPYLKIIPMVDVTISRENRVAMGKCANKKGLEAVTAEFLALKKTGFRCFNDCPLLTANEKKEMRFYLAPFFQMLKKDSWTEKVFLEK